jgi:hypothetical protein
MQYPNQPNPNQYQPPPSSEQNYSNQPYYPQGIYYAPYNPLPTEDELRSKNRTTLWIALGLIIAIIIVAATAIYVVLTPSTPERGVQGGWQPLRQPAAKFVIDFPGTPKEKKQSQLTAVGNIDINFYQLETNNGNMLYQIGWMDFPANIIASTPDKNVLLDGGVSGALSAVGGKKISENYMTLAGHPGRDVKLSVTSPVKGEFIMRVYLVNNRVYQIIAGGTVGKISWNDVNRFVNSFKLLA